MLDWRLNIYRIMQTFKKLIKLTQLKNKHANSETFHRKANIDLIIPQTVMHSREYSSLIT